MNPFNVGKMEVCETRGSAAAILSAWRTVNGLPLCARFRLVSYTPWKSIKVLRGGAVFSIPASIARSAPLSRLEVAAMVQLHGNVR